MALLGLRYTRLIRAGRLCNSVTALIVLWSHGTDSDWTAARQGTGRPLHREAGGGVSHLSHMALGLTATYGLTRWAHMI